MTALNGLKEKRVFRGLTQSAGAKIVGVTQSHYRKFESGEVRLDIQRAKLLADWLGCSMEELL
jgi:transcriptional regulator with XRE-family HTH domain